MATVSAQQRTLDGGIVDNSVAPRNGFAAVLYHASPDSDWQQLGEWYRRLSAEGLL